MESRKEIAVELSALSELVSGISRQTPYGVPDGYFQELPASVLGRIAGEGATFRVPTGYFEGLADRVLGRIKTGAGSGTVARIGAVAADGASLGEAESAREELARLSATLSQIGREMPNHMPEGYFDDLSPVLAVVRSVPAYRAPEGYFAELPAAIAAKAVLETGAAKVIPMTSTIPMTALSRGEDTRPGGQKVLKGHWWKYTSVAAVAACLLIIVNWPQATSTKGTEKPDTPEMIAQRLQKVSDQEIMAYLDDEHTFVADPATNGPETLDLNEGDVKSLLGDVSDSDLQQYVEEHGKAEDIATN